MKARVIKPIASAKRGGLSVLLVGSTFEVKEVDEPNGKVQLIDPINPEVVHEVAAEAVELFNEGLGIWESAKAWFAKVGVLFKSLGARLSKLLKRK